MKKIALLTTTFFFYLQFSVVYIKAQSLFGTTYTGGSEIGGTINKFTPSKNELIIAKSFEGNAEKPYFTNLMQAKNEKLYGMTTVGGSRGLGVIFSYEPFSAVKTILMEFNYTNGANPKGSLIEGSDGKLYGMTNNGGINNAGVIFSFEPSTLIYTKLKDFNNSDGSRPNGSLMQASDGKLYGMTTEGGVNQSGVIFSYDLSSFTYKVLKNFNTARGTHPCGSLIEAGNGKLYGISQKGGANNSGVIFSFERSSSAHNTLFNFGKGNGENPFGSLIQASDGQLYGMTSKGGKSDEGVIFCFEPNTSTFSKVKDFDRNIGSNPHGTFIQSGNGKLYAQTADGGKGYGVIFSFEPATSVYKNLKEFDSTDGAHPLGSILQASNGKMYGMTSQGGKKGSGVLYSFDPLNPTFTKLKDFGINGSGSYVSASLIMAADGKLYGMTSRGGNKGYGVIFSFDPYSSVYQNLMDFDYFNGASPYSRLTQASDGKLYGMTFLGGRSGFGVIFSFNPASFEYIKLKDFDDSNGYPLGSLIQATDGKLYGMTRGTMAGDYPGVIFSFDPSSLIYKELTQFDYVFGAHPTGTLIQATDGKLYGTTSYSEFDDVGSNGNLFSFDPFSSSFGNLKNFEEEDGNPLGNVIQANNGMLYGTTVGGGAGYGVIFSFNPSTSKYKKLYDFEKDNGHSTIGNFMQASNGKLYGMTYAGGSADKGVIFSFDPTASTYTKLQDYNGANGAHPYYGSGFIEVPDPILNIPPKVDIISPAHNATYLAGGNVDLSAAASDADGTISKVEFYNGSTLLYTTTDTPYTFRWLKVNTGNYKLTAKATDNSGLVTTSDSINISVVPNKAPTVSIINPANNQTFLKGATIYLKAAAKDPDGRITKVEFYNDSTLLATERGQPYTFDWIKVATGNYTITAKASDNWGAVTISPVITVSVVANKAPSVSIINPANGENFAAPATINLQAAAQDPDGRIVKVDFYHGATLLASERKVPYTYQWQHVPAGTYTITAVAQDNWGAVTNSADVSVIVTSNAIVSSKPSKVSSKNDMKAAISVRLVPNPAKNILNIYTTGWQNKQATLSLISASGVMIKTMRYAASSNETIQLNIASLVSGVYTIKLINGDKVMYKKFVKL